MLRIAVLDATYMEAPLLPCPGTQTLKGSWDLVTRVIIRVTILITPVKVLITLLSKSHDPPK